MNFMQTTRRSLVFALGVLLAWRAAAAPPARNLLVSLRIADDDAALGSAHAPAVAVHSTRSGTSVEQSVLVRNGASAAVRLAQAVPFDDLEVVWTPWGPGAALRSRWVELADGLQVRPSWPGGDAPVSVDLAIERVAAATGTGSGAVPAQWTVVSTVQVPLGEWINVAQLQQRRSRQAAVTTGGFGASTRSRQRVLQLRVGLA